MSGHARILVTGASGFIGARFCERLVRDGLTVRALVHSWPNAVRIAHLPIEKMPGNLTNANDLDSALADCDAVVHLATGGREGIVLGTRQLVAAALRRKVSRFVHMSTTAVYGLNPPPSLRNEDHPLKKVGEPYCDWKIAAETAVSAGIRQGLPAVILRPCVVYGPNSRWNINTIEKLRQGQFCLVDEGRGICNCIYVDNLIDAIMAALESERAVGHAFFLRDETPISWNEFASAHAQLLRPTPEIPSLPGETVFDHYRRQGGLLRRSKRPLLRLVVSPEFRKLLQTVPLFDRMILEIAGRLTPKRKAFLQGLRGPAVFRRPEAPIPDLVTALVQSCAVTFPYARARDLLGYRPRVPFQEGMAATAEWLKWAGYLH